MSPKIADFLNNKKTFFSNLFSYSSDLGHKMSKLPKNSEWQSDWVDLAVEQLVSFVFFAVPDLSAPQVMDEPQKFGSGFKRQPLNPANMKPL